VLRAQEHPLAPCHTVLTLHAMSQSANSLYSKHDF